MLPAYCVYPTVPPYNAKTNSVENPYNSRVLVHNWVEDRKQYHQTCPRCTGHSIYKSDYLPHHGEEYHKDICIPPKEFEIRSKTAGVGRRLLLNDFDYCDYLENYITTNDLMYNWDIRRAGCKPKPLRRWKLIMDGIWQPQPDNAVSFGNLTTIGFRKSPQLPIVPNDWKTYETDTSYKRHFVPKSYPNDYVLCRYTSSQNRYQETENMSLVPKLGVCDCCRFKTQHDPCCHCECHTHIDCNSPRFPTLIPQQSLKTFENKQNVHPFGSLGNPVMKREPHPHPVPGLPIYELTLPDPSCNTNNYCASLQESQRFQQGPSLLIDSNVC